MANYYNWGATGWANAKEMNTPSPYLTSMLSWLTQNYGGRNLGIHADRPITGGSSPSTHAYGAALDWGYDDRGRGMEVVNMIINNPSAYGISAIHDYSGLRSWHAGRGWVAQKQGSHGGSMKPGNSWFHFEVDPNFFDQKFAPQGGPGQGGNGMNGSSWSQLTPSSQLGQGIHWGDQKLTSEQIAQVAYQAGFRGQALVSMVAIAQRESTGNAQLYVNRPSTGDWSYGLWGLNVGKNMSMWSEYQAMGFTSPDELRTPLGNARAAFALYQKYGEKPWGGYKGKEWTYSTNVKAAQAAVNNAAQQGLLGRPWEDSAMSNVYSPAQSPSAALTLPTDAKLIGSPYGIFAVFDLGGGAFTHFGINWWEPGIFSNIDQSKIERISQEEWDRRYPGSVGGGNARELNSVAGTFGTFGAFWESILGQTIGYSNPARNDPEVRRVLAEFAARPDMTEAELQNKLKATQFWNSRTEAELQWNSISEGERTAQRNDMSARMVQTIFQFMGTSVNAADPLVQNSLEAVASGKIGFGAWTEQIKQQAASNPESPWSRQVRDETESQRQRPIDIENTSNQVRDTLNRWGLQWDDATIASWGRNLTEKISSDEDLMKEIKGQAAALFPWKDKEMETMTAAQPWLQTYNRVMEKEGSLFTGEIQQAMQAGTTAWDFEQQLKKSSGWMGTQNGQAAMYETGRQVGQMLGYE